jgi:molecular chaperone DnaK
VPYQQHTQLVTAVQVSADLLRYLVDLASQHLSGNTPQQVVITVPAYFNAQQRAATLEAAKLAGIPQVSLLQEPVAAAMAFGFGKPYDAETLLVFDLGGGTFDLSVVDSFEGIMEVLATGGDALLGGDDFDRELLQGLLTHLAGQHDSSSSSSSISPEVLAELLAAVEAAKCQLSTQETVQIPVSAAAATQLKVQQQQQPQQQPQQQQQQQDPATIQLSRQRMHELSAGLRQRLWQPLGPLADACKLQYACPPSSIEQQLQRQPQAAAADSAAGSNGSSTDPYAPNPRQLTAVVLVGGATRMPIIQQGLQVLTGLKPR